MNNKGKSENFDIFKVKKVIFHNAYSALEHTKLRLKGTEDVKLDWQKSDDIVCDFKPHRIESELYYRGHKLQKLDLNNGRAGDDFIMPSSIKKNAISYHGGGFDVDGDLVDFTNGEIFTRKIMDGVVDHNQRDAAIWAYLSDDKERITILIEQRY